MVSKIPELTVVENFSLSTLFTQKLAEWNHSTGYPQCGPLAAKIMGFVLGFFAALADFFIQAGLTIGKFVSTIIVLPFRCCSKVSQDLHLSSVLIHLMRTVHSLYYMVMLPCISITDPDKAYRLTQAINSKATEEEKLRQAKNDLLSQLEPTEDEELLITKREKIEHELKAKKEEKRKLDEQLQKLNSDLEAFQKESDRHENEIKTLAESYDPKKHQELMNALREEKNSLEVKLSGLQNEHLANLKPANHQTPIEKDVKDLVSQKAILDKKIEEIELEIKSNEKKAEGSKTEAATKNNSLAELKKKIEVLESQIGTIGVEIEEINLNKTIEGSSKNQQQNKKKMDFPSVSLKKIPSQNQDSEPPKSNSITDILAKKIKSSQTDISEMDTLIKSIDLHSVMLGEKVKEIIQDLQQKYTNVIGDIKLNSSEMKNFKDHREIALKAVKQLAEKMKLKEKKMSEGFKFEASINNFLAKNKDGFKIVEGHFAKIEIFCKLALNEENSLKKFKRNEEESTNLNKPKIPSPEEEKYDKFMFGLTTAFNLFRNYLDVLNDENLEWYQN
jgi:hypothetical protein